MRHALLAVALFIALSAAAQVDTTSWDPAAIRADRSAPIQLDIQLTTGFAVTGARLDLAAGGSIALSDLGGGHFRASLTPAQALFGYNANSVNHNFAGYRILNLYRPGSGNPTPSISCRSSSCCRRAPAIAITPPCAPTPPAPASRRSTRPPITAARDA